MPPERKLSDVFKAHARKVVEGREFEKLFRNAVEDNFTKEELKTFRKMNAARGEPDISSGIYVSDHGVYMSGAFLARNTADADIPPSIAGKVADAMDAALTGAKDHSAEVKSGALIPLKSLKP